jgi:CheY-like chemotaxis protein
MRTQTFLPTVLIIDDDSGITSYLRENFHDETPLGVLVANTMREAKILLETEDLPINVIVADLFFETATRDKENELYDGIDILKLAKEIRPDATQYILSIWSERDFERKKAEALGLEVKEWFAKMFYPQSAQKRPPWLQIYHDQLTKQLKHNEALYELFKEKGLSQGDKFDAIMALFNETTTPKTTFLQELNDSRYVLQKPIRVYWSVEDDEEFVVKDLSIGLPTEGLEETLDGALEDLATQIVSEKEMLDDESENLQGFAQLVKKRLDSHIAKRVKKDPAKIETISTLLCIASQSLYGCYSDPLVQRPDIVMSSTKAQLDKVKQKFSTEPKRPLTNAEKEVLQANQDRLQEIAEEKPELKTLALDIVDLIGTVMEPIPKV